MRSDIGDILQLLFFLLIVAVPVIVQLVQKRARDTARKAEDTESGTRQATAPPKPRVLSREPLKKRPAQAESIEDILSELFGGEPVRPATPPPLSPPPSQAQRVSAPATEDVRLPALKAPTAEHVQRLSSVEAVRMPSEDVSDALTEPLARYDVVGRTRTHPILRSTMQQGMAGWRRAIVLREILGPPVGMR